MSDEWRASFEAFYSDMGDRPSPKHTIERKNNSLGYSKANCEWATRTVQNRNKRNNVYMTMNGQTKCVTEWSGVVGIQRQTIKARLDRGWSHEKALTTPVSKSQTRKEV